MRYQVSGRSSGHLSTKTVLRTIDRLAKRGRDPGGFAQAEALQKEGHAPYPQAQPCGECAHGRRAGAHDPEAGRAQEALHDGDLCHSGAGPW